MLLTVAGNLHTGRFLLLALGVLTSGAGCADHLKRGDAFLAEGKTREAIIEYLSVIQEDENNREATLRLGPVLYDTGQIGPAFRYLQRGVAFEPDNIDLRVKLATIYLLGGSRDEAREEASAVLERDSNQLEALAIYASTVTTEGEIDGAIRRLESSRDVNEASAKFHLALGALHVRKGDTDTAEAMFKEAAAREPDSSEAHLALGMLYLVNRQPVAAKEEFDRAAEIAPVRSGTQIRVVDFYRLLGQPDEGDRRLDEIVADAADFLPAWRRIAQYSFADENFGRAREALQHLLENNRRDASALKMLGQIQSRSGEAEEARASFREAITVLQEYSNRRPEVASLHFQLAQLHTLAGETTQARNRLSTVLDLAPNSPSAALLLAELNIIAGQGKSAIEPLEDLIQRQPSAQAYDLLGRARFQDQDFPRATESFRKFAELSPSEPRAHHSLGSSLAAEGKEGEARQHLEEALRLQPSYVEPLALIATLDARQQRLGAALARVEAQMKRIEPSGRHQYLLGQIYMVSNQLDNAERSFRGAVASDPNLSAAYAQLAGIYVRTGRSDEAIAELDSGLVTNPENVQVMMLKGMVEHHQGAVANAETTYEQLLGVSPRFAPAANNLAVIYQENGELEEAFRLAEIAREESPDNPEIADTLGWILYERGTYERALGLLKEAAAGRPDSAAIQYHLGFTHSKLGHFQETADVLTRAIEMDPNSPYTDEARTLLDELR